MAIIPEKPHTIAVILFENFMSLDVTGPVDAFMAANEFWRLKHGLETGTRFYQYKTLSAASREVKASSGIKFLADTTIGSAKPSDFDAILIPGGNGVEQAAHNNKLINWITAAHAQTVRTISVCSGTWLLAKAGLLSGKRCSTHWRLCNTLQKTYPDIQVDADSLYTIDGKIISSAGVTSGIDMALALIEADMGRPIALDVARRLVVHLKRPGNQSQFSLPLKTQATVKGEQITRAIGWILDNLAESVSVEQAAEQAGMSVRSFSRHFKMETGQTPARFIEQARLDNARMMLDENPSISLTGTAAASGFSSAEHLTRAFQRQHGIHPNVYRDTFAPANTARTSP